MIARPNPRTRRFPTRSALAGLLIFVVVALAPICSASAAPALVTSTYQLASSEPLALAGSATLVAGYEGEKTDVVRSFSAGHSPVVIARVHPQGTDRGQIALAGSPTRIALLEKGFTPGYKGCCGTLYQNVVSGPLGGPLTEPTAGCQVTPSLAKSVVEERIPAHSAIALDGDVLAYDSFGCVVVRDFVSGLQRIVPLETTLDPVYSKVVSRLGGNGLLNVAGRLVAYRANPLGGEGQASIVVYDIDTGRELYRVPLPSHNPSVDLFPLGGPNTPTFGLQADGTLVIANGATCTATVSTIAHPSPLPLGVPACEVDGVNGGRALIVTPGEGHTRTLLGHDLILAWTTIEAPSAHPIADLGVNGVLETAAPVMGETDVLYTLNGCWAPSVYRAPLTEPGSPPSPPASCPVIVSPSYATLGTEALRVRIRCPLGCEGELEAQAGTAKELRRQESEIGPSAIVAPDISVAPGRSTTVTLQSREDGEGAPIFRALHRDLRLRHRVNARLDFNIQTPSADGAGSYHKAEELGIAYETVTHVVVPIRSQRTRHSKRVRRR